MGLTEAERNCKNGLLPFETSLLPEFSNESKQYANRPKQVNCITEANIWVGNNFFKKFITPRLQQLNQIN